ncbi:MAG: pyridoxamine 5'-phosphate oxidase family protein [Pseudomonadota bacterium]
MQTGDADDAGADASDQTTPFHAGEREAQRRAGVHERMAAHGGRFIRPYLPDQHRDFYARLPCIFAGVRGHAGYPWATVLTGSPGFVCSPSPTQLHLSTALHPDDPVVPGLYPGAQLGLLGLEFETRRRNRVNGRLASVGVRQLELHADISFGNCPQHIHVRPWPFTGLCQTSQTRRADRLSASRLGRDPTGLLARADTFFIATGVDSGGAGAADSGGFDVGHRGGPPGLLEVESERRVAFLDFPGNNFFNTIGNLSVDPRVGLLVVDFESGGLLHMAGRAMVQWLAQDDGRSQRRVTIDLEQVVWRPAALC